MNDGRPTPARRVALRVLERVRSGAFADRAFAGEARRADLSGQDRSHAHHLTFGTVQRLRTLDWLIDDRVRNPAGLEDGVRDVLRLAAYELGWSDAVADAVVVDQAVRLASSLPGAATRRRARRGLVNAVARSVASDIQARLSTLRDDTWEHAAICHSVPDWIASRLFAALGPVDGAQVLRAANLPAESIIRWNPLGGERTALEDLLPAGAQRCEPPFDDAYRLTGAFALEDSEIWQEGRAMAQSRASMLPVLALDPQPGERILDLCAAPGAKSMYLAARVGGAGHVTSVELHAARADGLRELATRMHATLSVVTGDARSVDVDGQFDAVLLDPPCSGLGVLGTRPDARWRRREESVAALAVLQSELLGRALQLVRPGGRVVYSTCTLLPEENELVVAGSAATLMDLRPVAPDFAHPDLDGALRTLPGRDGTDGFFVAGLRATATG